MGREKNERRGGFAICKTSCNIAAVPNDARRAVGMTIEEAHFTAGDMVVWSSIIAEDGAILIAPEPNDANVYYIITIADFEQFFVKVDKRNIRFTKK